MPRYMVPPAMLVFALVLVLGILYALPTPASAAHASGLHLEALLRLLSGRA
ncbi:MAG TPA: hypothetical protein VIG32_08945 [Candidatus Baltobacteraceae bacterium]